ncbi:hypothetical protein [Anaeromicropila populeti]|uniref:DNA-directed RNA polymerase specialized sigma subunit, sigma24 family n=1 Tax=Anaeromicropila populeti TaxID=37658 RepID=A0A1I6IL17_9FIRM|nr:hypothetical protein [Anaeromicropila populeti]SFR67393.1 DNA-directed RNA polymerase specialized sigma subunit, sigma24 family [Anaeromicropila populeti]
MSNQFDLDGSIQYAVNNYSKYLLKVAFIYTKNAMDSERIVREVFLSYLNKRPLFENSRHEKIWLTQITIQKSKFFLLTHFFIRPNIFSSFGNSLSKEEGFLLDTFFQLKAFYRILLHLYYSEKSSTEDLAGIFGLRTDTIEKLLTHSMQTLKTQFGEIEIEVSTFVHIQDCIRFTKKYSQTTLSYLADAIAYNAAAKKQFSFKKRLIIFSSLFIIFFGCSIFLYKKHNKERPSDIILINSSANVKVFYLSDDEKIYDEDYMSDSSLHWLSETDIFTRYNTSILKGYIQDIQNIEIVMGRGNSFYKAIATIRVDKVYRGKETVGSPIRILLNFPIQSSSDEKNIFSQLREGYEGIFMPVKFDDNDYRKENQATLYMRDLAEYYFIDSHFLFFQTDTELVYIDSVFSIDGEPSSLDEIEAYILKMLKNIKYN